MNNHDVDSNFQREVIKLNLLSLGIFIIYQR